MSSALLVEVARVLIAVSGLSIAGATFYHWRLSSSRTGEAPIRWSPLVYLGWAIEFGKRPIEFLQECQHMYGEVFGLVIAGHRTFFIADPFSSVVVLRPTKNLTSTEFHDSVLINFFGVTQHTIDGQIDENIIRKSYSQYLLGSVISVCFSLSLSLTLSHTHIKFSVLA
jgi:hypothetical protein